MSYLFIKPKPKPIVVSPVRFVMPTRVVNLLYEQGKITEEDYKKYLLSTDIHYLPPLTK